LVTADFNEDGLPDLADVNYGGYMTILLNQPGGNFGSPLNYLSPGIVNSLLTGDFTMDGVADLIVPYGNIYLYRNATTPTFFCGDINGSGSPMVQIDDLTYLVNFSFKDGPPPIPIQAADLNGSGEVAMDDITYLVNYMFKSGPAPTGCTK